MEEEAVNECNKTFNVMIIIEKPKMKPTLKNSISRTHAIGLNRASMISPKYSGSMFSMPDHYSAKCFRP